MWLLAVVGTAAAAIGYGTTASADTLEWALVLAYQNNPSLNAQRAALRAVDENVPQALSGYRPKLSATAAGGFNYFRQLNKTVNQQSFPNQPIYSSIGEDLGTRQFGATATQTLFNGFQTANRTRQAESQVAGARETLRVTEQQVLLDAATAYMNLLRDQAILDLNRRNVEVLTEQLKQTRDRFNVGEVTRTDVAQAESRLAAGRSQLLLAQSNYITSQANYRGVSGSIPVASIPARRLIGCPRRYCRGRLPKARRRAPRYWRRHTASTELAVKISEGALYPNLGLTAAYTQSYDTQPQSLRQTNVSILGQLTVPLYQGGAEYSAIRQNKETVGQQRLNLDVNRDQARATVVQSWGQLDAAKAQIEATTAQVNAAEIALNGVREEARVGQRTTLDVLNAQQELVNARVALVTAQHDRIVASYTLLAAVGGLSMQRLGLNVMVYDPQVHYQQVRDAWIGVRTPDGR
jgi:outer membrane protein